MDLDHAVAMVREKTRERYTALASENDETSERFEMLSGAPSNVAGIMHWLGNAKPDGA